MILRWWHGRVPAEKAGRYREFLKSRAVPDYRAVPGNVSVYVLERSGDGVTHFITMTVWKDFDAIRGFAGDAVDTAKYYQEDAEFLLEYEPTVTHYQVVAHDSLSSTARAEQDG